jgi:LysM repeat protein
MTTEEQTQTPETAVTQSPPVKQTAPNSQGHSELIKFGILVLVFFGIIAVVALSRSLIFDQILPAIVRPAPPIGQADGMGGALEAPDPAAYPAPVVEEAESELFLPTLEMDEVEAEEETAVDPVTNQPEEQIAPPEPISYVVQVGDTLTRIAAQHNVPVEALMEANGLINPNYIQVGQTLIIPVVP